ncbi:diguanylate cyclase domain-containing protein [Robertmurraya kyonggiensis]|uniref:Diguanylate cyclase n=1 Tax=Robertmurraya kyonggiensis TaxID=1037680 RepID=A0A4U1D9K8_9BACI|nr:diguanylate cyclase [Robertmurraya kyonggiensis]TKC19235.1 diguanylate cyclase [Robertmurraya kyonggiensis]
MYLAIGEIVEEIPIIAQSRRCEEIHNIFSLNATLDGVIVCEDERAVGLVMKTKFFQKLSTKYGFDLFMKRTIDLVMDVDFLVVESYLNVTEVSHLAMNRAAESMYDFVVVTKNGRYIGVVSIRDLLLKLSEIQIHIAKYSNPLTGLPGNYAIEEELNNLLATQQFSVFYFDINFFKFFNDTFGFKLGDELIKETARIISNTFISTTSPSFVGHIGGDDLIASIQDYDVDRLCIDILQQFDTYVKKYYSIEELSDGYIRGLNRNGIIENIPLVSLSIAVVQNKNMTISSVNELSTIAAKVKKQCKTIKTSAYILNEGRVSER